MTGGDSAQQRLVLVLTIMSRFCETIYCLSALYSRYSRMLTSEVMIAIKGVGSRLLVHCGAILHGVGSSQSCIFTLVHA